MTHIADTYRVVDDPAERITEGTQFKLAQMNDDFWAPAELFIGKRVGDLAGQKVEFRKLVCHEVLVA